MYEEGGGGGRWIMAVKVIEGLGRIYFASDDTRDPNPKIHNAEVTAQVREGLRG